MLKKWGWACGTRGITKRAFLNGRIDLAQAESVIDVINAKSDKEAKSGIKQLEGFLSKEIKEIKQEIMDVLVNIEVTIDYPEYDTPEVQREELSGMLQSVGQRLIKLEKSFDNGKIIKEGIKTAIIGKPNAGKSSLLNAILKEDRAIVTDIAGTTRDTIEEFVTINGIPLKLIDTAGIRDAKDEVEKIGIAKSKEIAKEADLIIAIFDSSKELTAEDKEILDIIKNKKSIILLNKSDFTNVIWFSTLLFLAFFFATISASLLISTAVIWLFSIYFASDTAILPLPVHKSSIFFAFILFAIDITSSTKTSVSCLGINTFSFT